MKTTENSKLLNAKNNVIRVIGSFGLVILLAGCGETVKDKRENLEFLRRKAIALDSLIEVETRKLNSLDSMLRDEERRVFSLDSIVMQESVRIDTLRWSGFAGQFFSL